MKKYGCTFQEVTPLLSQTVLSAMRHLCRGKSFLMLMRTILLDFKVLLLSQSEEKKVGQHALMTSLTTLLWSWVAPWDMPPL